MNMYNVHVERQLRTMNSAMKINLFTSKHLLLHSHSERTHFWVYDALYVSTSNN